MTVYFDPRKAKKPVEEMTEDEKNFEMGKQAMTAIANLTVAPLVLMLVWNACIPGTVSYTHLTLPTKRIV